MDLNILFEDEFLLCINKPAHLIVDPSNTSTETTLADILQKDFGIKLFRGGIVHRLDKDTSGVLIVAKTQGSLENLQSQFKERKTKKQYLVLVHGEVKIAGVVNAAIGRNPGNREKFIVIQNPTSHLIPTSEVGYREAVTEYEPLESLQFTGDRLQKIFSDFNKIQFRKLSTVHYNLFTLVVCRPLTGRTHQIRVHLKHIGFPIVSDEKYGGKKIVRLDKRWCMRMFLHAKSLGFFHPKSGEWMEVEAPLPEDLERAIKQFSNLAI